VRRPYTPHPDDPTADADPEAVFAVLEDADCRSFLQALEDPLTAAELSRRCGVPSSTTYRKLDRLTTVGLVESAPEVCGERNHRARYYRSVESIRFAIGDGSLALDAETADG